MSIENITKEHVYEAVNKIEMEKIELPPSTVYDVFINGKTYPPKGIMRYANLIANGKNEWELRGGSPTNDLLTALGFSIRSKSSEQENSSSVENTVKLLKRIGAENATVFLENASKLLSALNVKQDDRRVYYGTRGDKRLSITFGQRYGYAFIPDEEKPWQFLHTSPMRSTKNIEVEEWDSVTYIYHCSNPEEFNTYLDGITRACKNQLSKAQVSGFRKFNNPFFERAIFDDNFRRELFQEAFNTHSNMIGNVWKLGCHWDSNTPSFYNLLKKHSIVIGADEKLYTKGDLILITDGFTVLALAQVLESPVSVTKVPEFKKEFSALEIEYKSWINYAKAEWYELEKQDIFTYKLQQGIAKVNVPEIRNKAISLWNHRLTNYWVFQCNPSDFDFETALTNKKLNSWTISAHKDKIKKGDKVILWVTGKKAGCYALAKVTSDPTDHSNNSDNQLWKVEPKTKLQSGIEITHSLMDNPILWQTIKENRDLQDLKVGSQGTNFTATKQQYNTILNLISSKPGSMVNPIDLYINTILYGPPGTGKTYKLIDYKERFFTDSGITKSPDEVLRERLSEYALWKVLAAVLGASGKALSVSEIVAHPIVKAKVNPSIKTKPNNQAWADLQSFADDESTQLKDIYRRSIKLFHKENDSRWSIARDKVEELSDIIGQDLLDMAKNPKIDSIQNSSFKTRYNFITFHQKYSYEDFIEGIKPLLRDTDIEDQGGDLQFELKRGIFYNSCLEALKLVGYETFEECYKDSTDSRSAKFETAKNDFTKQFALFIDEINRANISAVFGELITLLEDDKRIGAPNELWLELPYSNEKFCVPGNLYVIGTMNTADRSIALLDIALRRRFEFKALYPIYPENEWWSSMLEAINKAIYTCKKNPDFFIGHAFFINKAQSEKDKILNTKIIPLLYEYCQNNADTVRKILNEAGIQHRLGSTVENYQIIIL
ncbi:MAG: AAA family ATPase [Saprospiraceae bacterium]